MGKRVRLRGKDESSPESSALDISSLVAAFSEEQVEKITKLTKSRLRYWASTDFFKPSYVEEGKSLPFSRFYSFKDVVALRTLEILRVQNNVPLQHLRKVAERLSHLDDRLWNASKLSVVNKKVILINDKTEIPEEVLTGQYVLPLREVISDTRAEIVAFRRRAPGAIGQLARKRGVLQNALAVAGTRIPVSAVQRLSEDGFSEEQIIAEYPDLTPEDVKAALNIRATAAA